MQYQIQAQNIKCGGCAGTIKTRLGEISGVSSVEVDVGTGTVYIEASGIERAALAQTLASLGYPEKHTV